MMEPYGNAAGALRFLAGRKALKLVRERGLQPDMVKVLAGAAGGPRWLVLTHLDRALFGSWLRERSGSLFLLGSSVGAWRFAVASRKDPCAAFELLESSYILQSHGERSSQAQVTESSLSILRKLLEVRGGREILEHPSHRLCVMAVRSRWPVAGDSRFFLGLGLADAYLYNYVWRGGLRFFFERALFYDPRDVPPFFNMGGFPILRIPLHATNLEQALMASYSVPMLMKGIKGIPNAPEGVYRDGGLLDYHPGVALVKGEQDITLFPHFMARVIPGWFDKWLPWRRPTAANMDRVLVVCPSKNFMDRLPDGRLPDKDDFLRFRGKDRERIVRWKQVVEQGRLLADAFMDGVQTGKIREMVEPMRV